MSEDTANKVLAYIKNQAEQNQAAGIQITYFGGEPLLNLKIIEKIGADLKQYCALHQIRFTANIVTNAIALTKEAAERLAEIGVNFAQITLDGTKNAYKAAKGLDAYDLVLEHIKSARNIFPVDIRLNIAKGKHSGYCRVGRRTVHSTWPGRARPAYSGSSSRLCRV